METKSVMGEDMTLVKKTMVFPLQDDEGKE